MSVEAISGFMQAGGSMFQAYGSIQDGKNQARVIKQNAQAQADAAAFNASQVQKETASNENMLRRQNRAAIAQQSAAQAQSGVAGAGTALNVMDQSLIDAELDSMMLRYNGQSQADAIRYGAQNTLAAGHNQAAAAKSAGLMGASGHLASAAASLYGVYRNQGSTTDPATREDTPAQRLRKDTKEKEEGLKHRQFKPYTVNLKG